jgi:hypothetical protein
MDGQHGVSGGPDPLCDPAATHRHFRAQARLYGSRRALCRQRRHRAGDRHAAPPRAEPPAAWHVPPPTEAAAAQDGRTKRTNACGTARSRPCQPGARTAASKLCSAFRGSCAYAGRSRLNARRHSGPPMRLRRRRLSNTPQAAGRTSGRFWRVAPPSSIVGRRPRARGTPPSGRDHARRDHECDGANLSQGLARRRFRSRRRLSSGACRSLECSYLDRRMRVQF